MHVISLLLELYSFIVLASMFLTWLPVNNTTRSLTTLVDALTEPLLRPIRNALPQGWQNFATFVLYFGLVILMRLI